MRIRRQADVITIWAPAKLNLFLEILAKRPDGFHEIESLYSAVSLYDTLTFKAIPNGGIDFRCRWSHAYRGHQPLPENHDNLALRALELLRARCAVRNGAMVSLTKRIPAEAGLGGASADAAAALVAAQLGWQPGLPRDELSQIAAELGSDVPFFLHSSPAICGGRGEQIRAAAPLCQHYVIVKPAGGLATSAVYAHCQIPRQPQRLVRHSGRWSLFNRLQAPASRLLPEIARLATCFDELGIAAHQMTGSGSAYFGICPNRRHALRAAGLLRQRGWQQVFAVRDVAGPGQAAVDPTTLI